MATRLFWDGAGSAAAMDTDADPWGDDEGDD